MQVDTILAHGTVVTMDDGFTLIEDGAVAMRGDSIADLGPTDRILRDHTAAEVIDCHECAIIPGLINAHTHVPMTLLRGLADDLRLDVWLMGYMMPVEREFVTPDFRAPGHAARLCRDDPIGCHDSSPICITSRMPSPRRPSQAGLRGVLAQTVLKFPAPDAAFLRRFGGSLPPVHREVEGPRADRARRGTARALHLPARSAGGLRDTGDGVQRAAAHARL